MNISSKRLPSSLILSTLLFCSTPAAFASDGRDAREVRFASIQGDVRLSRGDGKHTNLNKAWEQAQDGELLEQSFAVATGNGRAEIEFENGSTAYLAENSLLLFTELSAPGDRIVTRMTLPTGTATFALQPVAGESFFIRTPTDNMEIAFPETCFARMDAYLDATAITPQGEKGENVVRKDLPKLIIPKGQTVFFQGGEIVSQSDPAQTDFFGDQNVLFPFNVSEVEAAVLVLEASRLAPRVPGGLDLQAPPGIRTATPPAAAPQIVAEPPHSATRRSQVESDWDSRVSSRVQERGALMTAALKATGLSSPIPGLNDLFTHGSFFQCEPYGTCWEPTEQEPEQPQSQQTSQASAQSSAQNAPNIGFQPHTVEWMETFWGDCGLSSSRRVTRVARTPQELAELLRLKALAERQSNPCKGISTRVPA